jgi:two-component system, OmpR family, sensor histidine kinase PhoQ
MSPHGIAEAPYSLRKRLVLAFGLLLVLFLGLAGFVLDRAYQESVAAAVEERLLLQVYALLGVAEPDSEGFFVPDLGEPRFAQIDSGLYGFIFDRSGREVWRSPSALNLGLSDSGFAVGEVIPGQMLYGTLQTLDQGILSWAAYGIYWESQDSIFDFVVMESTAPTRAQIREFQFNLYRWFGALALLLSVAQYFLLRWGLRPLQQLAADLSAIEAGEQDQLARAYPEELKAVTGNLNLLIRSERDRQQRYRTTLGDLAHSLKTPLAVLSTALQEMRDGGPVTDRLRQDMEEQLAHMDQIISWQLKRAVKTNGARLLPRPVQVAPVLQRLLSALAKVYRDKQISLSTDIAEDALFYGEERDLMELCGNLLDNAFKYGNGRVEVRASRRQKMLLLEFNDDGKGIAEEDRQWVLERGARADTVKSGQGIGLAVAVEIIASYGGEIRVDRNSWGGASIKVSLGD